MIFIELIEVLELHERLIVNYGGIRGIRDEGSLQSALVAPQNRLWYQGTNDLPRLAATYAYHVARAHAFLDGNKRVAAVVSLAFVYANGGDFIASEDEVVDLFIRIAAGELTRDDVEIFFTDHVTS